MIYDETKGAEVKKPEVKEAEAKKEVEIDSMTTHEHWSRKVKWYSRDSSIYKFYKNGKEIEKITE